MTLIAEITMRGVSPAQYDALRARTGWLEQAPDGGIAHLTWWEGPDCHNVDAWESEAAFAEFAERRLAPAMAAEGLSEQPETTFHPAHEVFLPRAGLLAETAEPRTAAGNVAVIRHGYDMFAAGDIPGVMDLFDADILWYAPDSIRFGGRYVGPEAVGSFFASLSENYRELHVEPMTFVDGGDTVVVLGRHRATTVAGVAVELPFVHVWTFRSGKVTTFTEYFDTMKMNAALDPSGQASTAGTPRPVDAGQ